jgi:mono/diheme cytochrome c family protein
LSPDTGLGPAPMARIAPIARWTLALAVLVLVAGCRQDMHDQPRYKPLAKSDFFANGSSARMLPAHTVARSDLHADKLFYTGFTPDGDPTPTLPVPVTRELLLRGQERFNIFCSPCHGRTGEGRGMVVRRGYKQPPSYHIDRLRQAPPGYFFDIITNGFGVMPSYAAQIPAEDRWAIVAYVRTLQLSRDYDASKLSSEQRAHLDQPPAATAPAAGGDE